MSPEIDPELMQDFLTEAGELIEQLDADLLAMEGTHEGPEPSAERLNSAFRALHTIKGSAGFLGLEEIGRFTHAAEEALNRLRKDERQVTASVVDALLQCVDVLRNMTEALGAEQPIPACPEALMERLRTVAAGSPKTPNGDEAAAANTADGTDTAEAEPAPARADAEEPDASAGLDAPPPTGAEVSEPLDLPPQKKDLLGFMATDLREQTEQIAGALAQFEASADHAEAAAQLAEAAESMSKTAEFFELRDLCALVDRLERAAHALPDLADSLRPELLIRVGAVQHLIERQAEALEQQRVHRWPLETLLERLEILTAGEALDVAIHGAHEGDLQALLAIDGVLTEPAAGAESSLASYQTDEAAPGAETMARSAPTARAGGGEGGDAGAEAEAGPAGGERRTGGDRRQTDRRAGEQTIRVEVGRLENLLNLVGQMVLTKNRVLAMSRTLQEHSLPQELCEQITALANDLDRQTGNLQLGVMQTRMQPLAKLFDRYPRVIRDIARSTGKQIDLKIEGRETEVDKSVLELLGDPLVHILRNSADHGIEPPEDRTSLGKNEAGTLRLTAEHQGSHVRVSIADDGRGLDRQKIGEKAVSKGLVSAEQLAAMSDSEVYQLIFSPGFSTADQVSDLSGRGVGMDVVRSNVEQMNGTINIDSASGRGTTIEILIPLTVAIMPAMVVGVAEHHYCVPLQSIVEIVRYESEQSHSVKGQPVMRLRQTVLPLIDLRHRLKERGAWGDGRFVVVVTVGGQRAGLIVDHLVGQQEIVIKPLEDRHTQGGPFSGATIGEDGGVSLILDVVQLIRNSHAAETERAARRAA